MPKNRKIDDLPADDLDSLTTAKADWDGIADEVPPDEATPDKVSPEDEEILEDVLGVEAENEDDVIGEDDDNPYQESDEALPDDDEERGIARRNRREGEGVSEP
jgi:hypothetical protein